MSNTTPPGIELKNWNTVGTLVLPPTVAILIGIAALIVSAGVYSATRNSLDSSEQVFGIAAFCLMFGVAGISFLIAGARHLQKTRRRAERRRIHENEPWHWDNEWDTSISLDRARGIWKKALLIALFAAFFMVPFHVIARRDDAPAGGLWVVLLVIFDVAIIALVIAAIYYAVRRIKYGTVGIRFDRFPFFTGEQLDATMTGGAWLQSATRITAKLRHVRERIESRGSGKNRRRVMIAYGIFEDTVNYDTDALQRLDLSNLPIRFQIPADAESTRLGELQPAYWDLEIVVATPGVDYEGHFLLPVYRRAG